MKFPITLGVVAVSVLGLLPAHAQEFLKLGENGKTDYVIYHEPDAVSSIPTAAAELQSYFQKSAGFKPEIKVSATAPTTPYISLGLTEAARAAGVGQVSQENDGYRTVVRGKNLYILGHDTVSGEVTSKSGVSVGTSNGIYGFCEKYLGVKWVLPGDLGEEIPRRNSVTIPANLDHTEIPAFNYRQLPYIGRDRAAVNWSRRQRVIRETQFSRVRHSHNWEIIPASLYDQHPDWFALVNGKRQIPTGRYKLETTNPALVQAFADKVIEEFRIDPTLKTFSLSPSDGGGWSETPEALALQEKDPHGNPSRTPLVLKFYNDVAKIVGKEFPDRKLGGYIYADYLYPPAAGIPKLEPNLQLMVATSNSYGYQLHRRAVQEDWDKLMRAWGEAASASGAEIYYYDLPTYFKQTVGVVTPPAPEILNFVFSRLVKYGFDGVYIYGVEGWPQSGPTNYALAKLLWDPTQNAEELCREYYRLTYGSEAAPHIEAIYNLLDKTFHGYYNRHQDASYNLTPTFHTEIYGPTYEQVEAHFLKAQHAAKEPRQKSRLQLFGQILSLLQWNLKANNALPQTYRSALTLNDDEIDILFMNPGKDINITALGTEMKPETANWQASSMQLVADLKVQGFPTRSDVRMLLYAPRSGEITLSIPRLNSQGEFVRYILLDASNRKQLRAGALRAGRVLRFPAEAGKAYLLDIANTWSSLRFDVEGAQVAYKTNVLHRGFRVETNALLQEKTPMSFDVPEGGKEFSITINGGGVVADVVSPSGKVVGTIDTRSTAIARVQVPEVESVEGTWQLVMHRPEEERNVYVVLDKALPQWFYASPQQVFGIKEQS